MTNPDKTLINLRIDRDLAERGKQLAAKRGSNLSTLLRMLLIQELEADASRSAATALAAAAKGAQPE